MWGEGLSAVPLLCQNSYVVFLFAYVTLGESVTTRSCLSVHAFHTRNYTILIKFGLGNRGIVVRLQINERDFFFFRNSHTGSRAH